MIDQLPANLQEAIQPYLEKGFVVVNASEAAAELFKAKKKMGWWVAVLDTGTYARNQDRTAYCQVTETGEIEITGDTLDKLKMDEVADKGVKTFRLILLVIVLGFVLLCVVCVVGGMLSG
jgi:hypothetical protein